MPATENTVTEQTMTPIRKTEFSVWALYLGEGIDVRGVAIGERVSQRPLTILLESSGLAVVFRYGAVVFFDVPQEQIAKFVADMGSFIEQPYAQPETEVVTVRLDPDGNERLEGGIVSLRDASLIKLQTLASVLGKTVVLAQYEADIASNFDRIEPFAAELLRHGRGGGSMRELLRHIGRTLLDEHKLLGRVEVADKPELLWDHPELEGMYARLESEYEIGERAAMLDRKLELISRTIRTVLELLENRRSLRVEWYIVLLIVVEIGLLLYEMCLR